MKPPTVGVRPFWGTRIYARRPLFHALVKWVQEVQIPMSQICSLAVSVIGVIGCPAIVVGYIDIQIEIYFDSR